MSNTDTWVPLVIPLIRVMVFELVLSIAVVGNSQVT